MKVDSVPDDLIETLRKLQLGETTVEQAAAVLSPAASSAAITENAHVDLDRERRCGFPEVVYCEGKTPEAVVEILGTLREHTASAFATRVSGEQADVVLARFPDAEFNPAARTLVVPGLRPKAQPAGDGGAGRVAVVTAGTSDRPVAEEALATLRWMGCEAELIVDVGVAGPHRLAEHRDRFVDADAVVVVAGMEGALPSVVGGWVACPVVAVPTSVGYGANFGGISALLGMLNSCAANVTVVNIDSGFKGGYVAGLIAARKHSGNSKSETRNSKEIRSTNS